MIEVIAIAVFVFVVIVVAGWRMIDEANARKAKAEADRRKAVIARQRVSHYTGPRYSVRNREVG